jgi:hypothetical protein
MAWHQAGRAKKLIGFRPVVTTDAQVLWCEEELVRFARHVADGRSCLVHAILASVAARSLTLPKILPPRTLFRYIPFLCIQATFLAYHRDHEA